jgi:hypothetical protein
MLLCSHCQHCLNEQYWNQELENRNHFETLFDDTRMRLMHQAAARPAQPAQRLFQQADLHTSAHDQGRSMCTQMV